MWLVARPYVGLRHDGVLYLGQALLHLHPGALATDLFFSYGSQDSFTVFSRGLAWLYARWDIAPVQMLVLAACHGLLMVSAWTLMRPLSLLQRQLGLCALAVMSHQYGGHGIFAFAERFVTARTLAEPLALLALTALVRERWLLAAAAAIATSLVHPLVGVGILVTMWCWLVRRDHRWLWAALSVLAAVGLALLDVKPLNQLLQRYDPDWWRVVEQVNGHVLLRTWPIGDLWIATFDFGVLALATRWLGQSLGRVCLALFAAASLLVAVSALGADLTQNILITQLQLWRILWLVHLTALALLPAIVLHAWQQPGLGRIVALSLVAAALAVYPRWPTAWAFIVLSGLTLAGLSRGIRLTPGISRRLVVLLGVVVAGLSAGVLAANWQLVVDAGLPIDHLQLTLLLATLPTLSLPMAGVLLASLQRPAASSLLSARVAAVAGTLVLAAYGAVTWDRRSPMTRAVETALHAEHPFQAWIPERAQVYWSQELAATWALLRRPSHWSVGQGSGVLFNRQNALAFDRRAQSYRALELQERVCALTDALDITRELDDAPCTPTPPVLAALCRSEGGPDFLIFRSRLAGTVAQWTVDPRAPSPLTWYLYDCSQLR